MLVIGVSAVAWGEIAAASGTCAMNPDCVNRAGETTSITIDQLANEIGDWVGQGGEVIGQYNKSGDFLLRSDDNSRQFRFDFNNPRPHLNPHFHFEWTNENGVLEKVRIWPNDVDHN